MGFERAIVITTINYPTEAVKAIATLDRGWHLIVVGDQRTPKDWHYDGVSFLDLTTQSKMPLRFPNRCPMNSYTRKNIGYLYSLMNGAVVLAETDDDNRPYDSFLESINPSVTGPLVSQEGWVNVYRLFTRERIWPRGFPLEDVRTSFESLPALEGEVTRYCPIQQYLADGDPDVDAIYRLICQQEVLFSSGSYILSASTFCPFNSQNTVWWPEAFPLLYLPSHVTFRVTDIWRSFVAQICLHSIGGDLAFHGPTVFQDRNIHSLILDFADEVPGYLQNHRILELLTSLELSSDPADTCANLRLCYKCLTDTGIIPTEELDLVDLWIADIQELTAP